MQLGLVRSTALAVVFGWMALTPVGSSAQSPEIVAQVRAVNDAFDAALTRRDIAAIDAAWVQDAGVMAAHPPSKAVETGWEAVRKSWQGAFANFPTLEVAMQSPVIRVMGDVAVVAGVERIRGIRPNGDAVEFSAMTTNVYERRDGRWLMVHHQASRMP